MITLEKSRVYTDEQIEEMVMAYTECALWSTPEYNNDGETGECLDANYDSGDLSAGCAESFAQDCESFVDYVGQQLRGITPAQAGHDFWLTRNHHGVGFWDRGLGVRGEALTVAAHTFGEVNIFAGDDGEIHTN